MSRQELADNIGVTVAAVYQWEGCGGKSVTPTVHNLDKLVDSLGITMAQFYGRVPRARRSA